MAIEIVFANSITGHTTGAITDIDEGVTAADGALASTSTDGKNETFLIGFAAVTGIVDADTVNSVKIRIRASMTGPNGEWLATLRDVETPLGGGIASGALGTSLANFEFVDVTNWDLDWTQAQLDSLTVALQATQGGMPDPQTWHLDAIELEIDYTPDAGGGQNIAVNTAIETDTAQPVVAFSPQTVAVNFATETDTGLIVVPDDGAAPQLIAVNTAIETDTALVLDPRLILNRAVEADTARAVSPVLIIGQAVETDTGLKLDPLLILQIASEADTALVINPDVVEPQFITPGIAIEVDTGRPISALQILNIAEETDTALTVVPALNVSALLGIATDTETARLMTPVLTLGLAIETDTGRLTTPLLTIGRAAESDSALAITPKLILQIASEADTALLVNPAQNIELAVGLAIETDTALVVNPDLTIITFGAKYNILHSFPTGQGDVVVILYDPITGNSVALDDTECKEIGNTGMYIWGNDKLTTQPIGYKEFVYQMTDGVTTVDGVFVMPQYELVEHLKALIAAD